MTEEHKPDLSQFPKYKPNAIVASFPPALKDPKNYWKIKKAILEEGRTTCSHSEVAEWASCLKCHKANQKRSMFMYELGFKTAAHYRIWERIMKQIPEHMKVTLPKYNSK